MALERASETDFYVIIAVARSGTGKSRLVSDLIPD
jgi:hypothetical protein